MPIDGFNPDQIVARAAISTFNRAIASHGDAIAAMKESVAKARRETRHIQRENDFPTPDPPRSRKRRRPATPPRPPPAPPEKSVLQSPPRARKQEVPQQAFDEDRSIYQGVHLSELFANPNVMEKLADTINQQQRDDFQSVDVEQLLAELERDKVIGGLFSEERTLYVAPMERALPAVQRPSARTLRRAARSLEQIPWTVVDSAGDGGMFDEEELE